VSIKIICVWPRMAMAVMRLRVVCTLGVTIATLALAPSVLADDVCAAAGFGCLCTDDPSTGCGCGGDVPFSCSDCAWAIGPTRSLYVGVLCGGGYAPEPLP